MSYSVYKHTFPNGKVYIGITSQKPEYRWKKDGRGYLQKRGNVYTQPAIAGAIIKYGWNNIKHEVLFKDLTKEEAEIKEVELIAIYKSNQRKYGYNIESGGNANKMSDETKQKISKAFKGEKHPFYGKTHTDEVKNRLSKIYKERFSVPENNPFYGKHHTEETKRKIGESHKKENLSKKTLEKMSKAKKGKKRSKESIEKGAKAHEKPVVCIETGFIYHSAKEAEIQTGTCHITEVCKNKRKTAGGCHWKYLYDQIDKNGTIIPGAVTLGLVSEKEALKVLKNEGR